MYRLQVCAVGLLDLRGDHSADRAHWRLLHHVLMFTVDIVRLDGAIHIGTPTLWFRRLARASLRRCKDDHLPGVASWPEILLKMDVVAPHVEQVRNLALAEAGQRVAGLLERGGDFGRRQVPLGNLAVAEPAEDFP